LCITSGPTTAPGRLPPRLSATSAGSARGPTAGRGTLGKANPAKPARSEPGEGRRCRARISMGDRVRWQDKVGHFHRDLGDGNAEVTIANRAYRVRIAELRPG